jgi:predicted nucleic acid-binding Zn ribbon protein
MLTSINGDLKRSINKAGIDKQVKAAQVCQFWQETIKGIFGQKIAEKSQAIKFKNGALTVAVLSSVLAQEFKFKEDEIKGEINKKVGYNLVKKIRFEI